MYTFYYYSLRRTYRPLAIEYATAISKNEENDEVTYAPVDEFLEPYRSGCLFSIGSVQWLCLSFAVAGKIADARTSP
jgi:hypothetical protein